jgi:predicted acyltransferase
MNERLVGSLAVALAAFFAGAAIYITVAEQPARLLLDNENSLLEWKNTYPVGVRLQGTLAILAGLAGIWAWWLSRDWRWILGAVLMLANWPYTFIVMHPVNTELGELTGGGPRSRTLIETWGSLHAVRGGLGLLATLTFLWVLNRQRAKSPNI